MNLSILEEVWHMKIFASGLVTGGEGGVGGGGWDRYNTKGERIGKCAREPGEAKTKVSFKRKSSKNV